MVGRDRYPIRHYLAASQAANSTGSGPLAGANLPLKTAELVHSLRETQPTLRLVGDDDAPSHPVKATRPATPAAPVTPKRPPTRPEPALTQPTDPRWMLAMRTAESLQGTILGPERRERLIKVGKLMGLTAFDANLVIAIVQDQARRGYAPEFCPVAGEPQLAMVPLPRKELTKDEKRTRRITIICSVISMLVAIEVVVLRWIFS